MNKASFLKKISITIVILMVFIGSATAQFVHPGLWHKESDLDRMKFMVESQMDPWYSSYLTLKSKGSASYNYTVRKDPDDNTLSRENPSHQRYQYEDDAIAAYHNALMWYITGDSRHAKKSIEILNAWADLTSFYGGGTEPLCAGLYGAPLINAAEIIKNTYGGWSEAEIKKFGDMLVYPGYSNTTVPTTDIQNDNVTFYWRTYLGDPGRHGNQGLLAWRTVMAIGVFLDNEIIYDRALNNILGRPHRADDLPYPSGPAISNGIPQSTSNEYYDEFKVTSKGTTQDYGFDDQIQHYIYENGQCQEASRDQAHSSLGIATIAEMMEVVWNQGSDIYSYLDDRVLLGIEYNVKYNMSEFMSYPDQPEPWEPTVESGEFLPILTRCGRWKSLKINPWVGGNLERNSRGEARVLRPVYELPVAHFAVREGKMEAAKWSLRARDYASNSQGYEQGDGTDAPGWGGLTFHRPDGCAGDPISGFSGNTPTFSLSKLPGSFEAVHYDFFSGKAEGRTYHDVDTINMGGEYRLNDGVDIETSSEGGYKLTSIENGEWLTYTVAAPSTGLYDIAIRYASVNANGKIKFSVAGTDISSELSVPFGNENSTGSDDWKDLVIAKDVILKKGVQALKVHFSGASNAFALKSFAVTEGNSSACSGALSTVSPPSYIVPGINYNYYQGTWNQIPDFSQLTPKESGISENVSFIAGAATDNFAMDFEAFIDIPLVGSYTFYTQSDEGSRLYIDGILVVNNDGIHTELEKSGSVCLKEGLHKIRVEYFEKTGDESLNVMFEGRGVSKRKLENIYAIDNCSNVGVELPDSVVDGISYYFYKGDWTSLPNFDKITVDEKGVLSGISLNIPVASANFGMVFKGYFNIPVEDDYTFYTTSDDGSRLNIDGIRVVSNDGEHGAVEASGRICLGAGYHEIEVEYFDGGGGKSLKVEYEGGGITRKNLTGFKTKPVAGKILQHMIFEDFTAYLGEADFDPGATTNAGLPISYLSYTPKVATIVDGKIHLVGVGKAIIYAVQAGNANYTSAQAAIYLTVAEKENQGVQFDEIPTKYIGDADFDPGAVATSGLPVTYVSYNTTVATIVDNKIHIVGEGKAIILAKQAGNNQFNPAQAAIYLTVEVKTGISDAILNKVKVYPNPVKDKLIIELTSVLNTKLEVYNFLGRIVLSQDVVADKTEFDLGGLTPGLYVLKIKNGQSSVSRKIVKE